MINSLKLKLLDRLNTQLGVTLRPQEDVNLMGKPLRVIKGSIRSTSDYDDAWSWALARRAEVVFDVGANIGQSALLMLQSPIIKKLYLVDPNPEALSFAAENLFLNNLSQRAVFIPAFVSDQADQSVDFWTAGPGAAGSMYDAHAESAKRVGQATAVSTTTLDTLLETHGDLPDYVKIDVEGAESLVLAGATALAARQHTQFMVEMHSNPDLTMRENATKILAWCKAHAYAAYYLKEHCRLTAAQQIQHRGRCHLLLIPEKATYPAYLRNIQQSDALQNN